MYSYNTLVALLIRKTNMYSYYEYIMDIIKKPVDSYLRYKKLIVQTNSKTILFSLILM